MSFSLVNPKGNAGSGRNPVVPQRRYAVCSACRIGLWRQCRLTLTINSRKITSDQSHTTAHTLHILSKCLIKKRSSSNFNDRYTHLVTNHDQPRYQESTCDILCESHPWHDRPAHPPHMSHVRLNSTTPRAKRSGLVLLAPISSTKKRPQIAA